MRQWWRVESHQGLGFEIGFALGVELGLGLGLGLISTVSQAKNRKKKSIGRACRAHERC